LLAFTSSGNIKNDQLSAQRGEGQNGFAMGRTLEIMMHTPSCERQAAEHGGFKQSACIFILAELETLRAATAK